MTGDILAPGGRRKGALARRIALIVEHEPSWFAEFICATGIFGWSLAALLTDEIDISGFGWALPLFGMVFGPIRILALLRLDPEPRVLAACFGFVWWIWLIRGLSHSIGIVPSLGAFLALAFGDVLTVGKFSLAAYRLRGTPGVR